MEIIKCGEVSFLVDKCLLESGLKHGFTLRYGGVSEGEYDSLNVGLRRGDDPGNAIKNIYIAARALKLNEENLTLTYQTHTDNVVFLERNEVGLGITEKWDSDGVDAIVTDMEKVPLMCYSADCVPTLFYDGVRRMIGAVHGGWRGTAKNIVSKTVDIMVKNGCDRGNIKAIIGPAIGGCCYEVSKDVGEVFDEDYSDFVKRRGDEKYMVDLKEITKAQLIRSGLSAENVIQSGVCTMCENDKFFSHRAQSGKSGLLGGFIQLA